MPTRRPRAIKVRRVTRMARPKARARQARKAVQGKKAGFSIGIPPIPIPGDSNRRTGGFGGGRADKALGALNELIKKKERRISTLKEKKRAQGTVARQSAKRATKRTAAGRDATKATERSNRATEKKFATRRKVKRVTNLTNRLRQARETIKKFNR